MRAVRRHDLSPRVESMPLIDVIFLLLTFFISSMVTMVRAEILPVQLQTLTTGQAAEPAAILAVTIDARGGLYLNRSPIESEQLDKKLNEAADLGYSVGVDEWRPALAVGADFPDHPFQAQHLAGQAVGLVVVVG